MNQAKFDALMRKADGFVPPPTTAPSNSATQSQQIETPPEAEGQLEGLPELTPEAAAPSPRDQAWAPAFPGIFEAFAGGVAKSAFETGDFLFGDTPEADQTSFRQAIEARDSELKSASILSGFSSGVGQFAGAMVGLGKVATVTKLVPWFGKGLGAVTAALPKTAEVGKAALAGAVAFDPHEERLSNLVQDTPLANPVTAWLAADPTDSAAEGRIKSALESIGLDVAIIGTFLGSTKVWKSLRKGDADGASNAVDAMQAEQARHIAESEGLPTVREDEGVQALTAPVPPQSATDGATEALGVDGSAVRQTPQVSPAAPTESANGIPTTTLIRVTEEDTAAVLRGMTEDAAAIEKAGGWYEAIEAGHTFGRGEGIPYAKLNADRDVDDFMARVVDASEEQLDDLKGGAVLSDVRVTDTVSRMANLFDTDPAQLLGSIQQAGTGAAQMVTQMEAGYLVANRMLQDSYALATRIRLGDFSEFGSYDAAMLELKRRITLASSVYGSARSITAASGRALRRMRFQIDPEAFNALKDVDGERMIDLLAGTEGNPRAIARLVSEPSLWTKVKDWGQFLLINNLVSGPKTQLINLLSNSYMVGARPLERLLGSAYGAARGAAGDQRIFKEALRQYTYLGTAFTEGFRFAGQAFMRNDSILSPQRYEATAEASRSTASTLDLRVPFKPWDNPGNIIGNALRVAAVGIGMPTRALGFVDEAVKQTVYRSKVMASAHVGAVEEGIASGLSGDALRQYVRLTVTRRVEAAFDGKGRSTDPDALREAQTATFQQELLPNTFGQWVSVGADKFFPLRMVMPFVRTPTNIIRYGWKMTPGLNLLQTEYRDMLKGRMGQEAKVQATGQMMVGGLFMGSAAMLVSQGTITGGGPKDPLQRAALQATGWQPYSVVVENADGSKTFIPFGRIDPIAIPFGIIADLQDALVALNNEETPEFGAAVGALLVAVSRQFRDKTYLSGVDQALNFLSDPAARRAGNFAGQTVSNFLPYASALRQLNPDPYIRDARDMTDKLLATIPGLSETVPPRYDAFGDPVRKVGLWSSDDDQLVDREMQRLVLESGATITTPNPVANGVDLREVTMADGRNAWVVYQELAGHPPQGRSLKDVVARRMQSRAYQLAPDGEVGTKGTRLWMLHEPVSAYRERAMKRLKRDPNVRDAFRADDLKAREQYRANRAANPPAPAKKLGDSFGVDLKALDTNR